MTQQLAPTPAAAANRQALLIHVRSIMNSPNGPAEKLANKAQNRAHDAATFCTMRAFNDNRWQQPVIRPMPHIGLNERGVCL
jgi:hypothetical protein